VRATHKARESFVADLIRECPKANVWAATRLMRFGSAVESLVHDGNFSEIKYRRIQSKITGIAKLCECGVLFITQSPCVRLITPSGKQIGVPTS
jgi:hypothetical protein